MFFALSHNQCINIGSKSLIANGILAICACPGLFDSYKVRGFVSGALETPHEAKLMEKPRFRANAPRQSKNKKTMTTRMKIAQLAMAAVQLAGAWATQAQTNTTTVTTTTTTTVVTTNNTAITNIIIKTTTNTAPAQPKVPIATNGWKSSVAVGVTVARGNTDTTQVAVSGSTQKKWLQNSLIFGADGLYGETKPPGSAKETESAETAHGFSQYNRVFGDNFYAYGLIDGFHDGIADIKYRLTLAPGIGYYFVTNKTMDVMGEIGPGYIREQLEGETESFATLRIAQKLHYNISPNARAWETIEYLPQIDEWNNYIVNVEVGIEAKLTKGNKLSLRSVVQDSYNNVPAAGRLRNDLKIITSLVYNF
jgi:putative salt-induced outer membrane protein